MQLEFDIYLKAHRMQWILETLKEILILFF